jgi:hypothetical protein
VSDDEWRLILDGTHEAVRDFARAEFAALARKAIHRLQRINALGIFGGDYIYNTLWDEYCHEVQEGPHDLLECAWDQTLETVTEYVVERVPRHVAVLLSIFAAWKLDEEDDPNLIGSVWPNGIKRVLRDRLAEQAGMRNLHRLGPWRNT